MDNVNFNQIKLARESRGLTQTQLARFAHIAQSNLSKMEVGKLPIPDDALLRIATTLKYPLTFFYKKSQRTPMGAFYFRKRMSLSKTSIKTIESKRDIIRSAIDDLLQAVEVKECTLPHIRVTDNLTPSDIARRVRAYFKLPKGPIQDLVKVLEDAGIIVYEMDFNSDKFMGFSIYTDAGQPIIFVNKNMPNDRKRFTLGHELGHLVMHIMFDTDEDDRQIEIQADEFSSEFNMPFLDCYFDIQRLQLRDLDNLKSYWKMSKAAILRRAYTAKTIDENRYKYYMIELSRIGERKVERGYVDLDKPTLLSQILDMHTSILNYTKSELANMLGLNMDDYNEYFYGLSKNRLTIRL
ncbi:XRE family transcriptional regulator [Alistipes indistinctus]|uniref:XRE family transcriptional regulator n=1 Tax=Alistipes indistinctus TaxID=626932 RepID=UPI0015F1E6F3|nr:XRE family transcriptional regulator [Alistipes indistinctus]BCG54375.1 hypothetical protein AI2BBH_14210 [Alistipes indistinctus]